MANSKHVVVDNLKMLHIEEKIFLQQMLENDYIPLNDAIAILTTIKEQLAAAEDAEMEVEEPRARALKEVDEAYLRKSIREINNEIKYQELAILIAKCEVSSDKYVALINTLHSDITETQTHYNEKELSYWLPLMDEIIKSDCRSLDRISCLNLPAKYNIVIGLDETEQFIEKCLKKGYLVEKGGQYYLGSKTVLEFNNDLRSTYEDYIQICELCSELCCYGRTCVNCNKLMHEYCIKTVLESTNDCPLCNVRWEDFDFEKSQQNTVMETQEEEVVAEVETAILRRSERRRK